MLKFNDMNFPINWFQEQEPEDVREMIICACDSVTDSGFEIFDTQGKAIDLGKLDISSVQGRGEKYTVVKAEE